MDRRVRKVDLSDEQHQELIYLRNSATKAYLRERAAAILKIAEGKAATQVAKAGLLRVRKHETVLEWLNRYQQSGARGLEIKPGRGRKAAFFP